MSHHLYPPNAPLVVQVGFAGARLLFDPKEHPDLTGLKSENFHQQVEDHLVAVLQALPDLLGLTEHHILCGVSSAAIGGDTLFIRACQKLGHAHRILLPQPLETFLAAKGSSGADFNEQEEATMRGLLNNPLVIEQRVVSDSETRDHRFEDVNREIVRISDVVIALQRAKSPDKLEKDKEHALQQTSLAADPAPVPAPQAVSGKPGGTGDLTERARLQRIPLLEITVQVCNGGADFLPPKVESLRPQKGSFRVPAVPKTLSRFHCAKDAPYLADLKKFASGKATRHQLFFKITAFLIIGAHVAASILAVTCLAFHHDLHGIYKTLLIVEVILLGFGFLTHLLLHITRAVEYWATARLIAEILRSVSNLQGVQGYLRHLFILPLPPKLRSVWRTINYFHLQANSQLFRQQKESAKPSAESWKKRRDEYVTKRLADSKSGQIAYYTRRRASAVAWLRCARCAFYIASILAIGATSAKISLYEIDPDHPPFAEPLAFCAILLPILAVAALSLAASFDLEASVHTYGEMIDELTEDRQRLDAATSEREFTDLAHQTEARLVGENAGWFARRIFTGVA